MNNIILIADLNDLRHKISTFCCGFKLRNIVNFPTRGGVALDCCFTNKHKNYDCLRLSPLGKSDHYLFKCFPKVKKKQTHFYKSIPDYSPSNKIRFDILIRDCDFQIDSQIVTTEDLNYFYDNTIQKIDSLLNEAFTLKSVRCLSDSLPWITDPIRICMKHRDIAFRAGNIVLFRHYRKKVKNMISLAKNRYISRVNSLSSKTTGQK